MRTNRMESVKEKDHKRGKGITTLDHINFSECLGFMGHVEEGFLEDLDTMGILDITDIMGIMDNIKNKMTVFVNALIVWHIKK